MLSHPGCRPRSTYPHEAGRPRCPSGRGPVVGVSVVRDRATSLGGRSRGVVTVVGAAPAPAPMGLCANTGSWSPQCFPAAWTRKECARQYLRPQLHPPPLLASHSGHPTSDRSAHGPDALADMYWQGGVSPHPPPIVLPGRWSWLRASSGASSRPGRGCATTASFPPSRALLAIFRLFETAWKASLIVCGPWVRRVSPRNSVAASFARGTGPG